MHGPTSSWRHPRLLAVLCLTAACSSLAQGWGANQNAHYALVRALAYGTPTIDRSRFEVGDAGAGDISAFRGHVYAAKAPGLAFATLPAYFGLKVFGGTKPAHDNSAQLWFLSLWAVVLPGAILLFLVRRIGDELEPGFGAAATVTLGLGTLILPFSTLFFSHVFSALLGFAAFTILWYERRGPARLAWLGAAGLLAGYAITTEFPSAISAAILGVYALTRSGPFRRALAYGAGAIVGILPLLLFNQWAFGSPTHLAYANTVGFGPVGAFYLRAPSFRPAMELLFSSVGLLRLTPVVALGAVGTFLLYRRGSRPEALLIAGIAVAYFIFNSSYTFPLGGASPGPRYLTPILPFLAVPLAVAYRNLPVTTLGLAVASVVEIVAVTITRPLSSSFYGNWFERFASGDFSQTAIGLAGGPSRYGIYLFLVMAVLAVAFAGLATRRPCLSWRDAVTGTALLGGWVLVERRGPKLLDSDLLGEGNGALVVLLFATAIALAAAVLPRVVATGSPSVAEGSRQRW
jgi:hypothetical protein